MNSGQYEMPLMNELTIHKIPMLGDCLSFLKNNVKLSDGYIAGIQ